MFFGVYIMASLVLTLTWWTNEIVRRGVLMSLKKREVGVDAKLDDESCSIFSEDEMALFQRLSALVLSEEQLKANQYPLLDSSIVDGARFRRICVNCFCS